MRMIFIIYICGISRLFKYEKCILREVVRETVSDRFGNGSYAGEY